MARRSQAFGILETARVIGYRTTLESVLYDLTRRWQDWRFGPPPVAHVEGWYELGPLNAFKQDASGVVFHSDTGSLRVDVLAEDTVRVRLSPDGAFPPIFSYAVIDPNPAGGVPFEVQESSDTITIHWGESRCEVSRADLRLRIVAGDTLVCEDLDGLRWRPGAVLHSLALTRGETGHGLGERAFGLDLRGRTYGLWNTDPAGYGRGDDPINLCIPFYVGMRGEQAYGVFWDNPARGTVAVGAPEAQDELTLQVEAETLCYYVFTGPSLKQVLEQYTALTGRMALPPLWMLGYQQCRWSYMSANEVRAIGAEFRQRQIPCDALYLDIDYMNGFRCFTWDATRFPQPRKLVADLKADGFKTVVILDPGIKTDPNYAVCRDGLQQDVFLKYPDGKPFVAPVWPGNCYFPDFTNPRARTWWGRLYAGLLADGIAGFWNDMGEPALFCPTKANGHVPDYVPHDFDGHGATHKEAHNVYGMQMGRASREGLDALEPDRRHVIIVRAAYAGIQRYTTSWTGDNLSTWDHLPLSISMLLNLGLSGLAFTGPDIGGFGGNADGELFVRWVQLGAFLPFFRGHTAKDTIQHEPWAFGQPYEDIARRFIELRYRFLPVLYTAVAECAAHGWPIVRPLALLDPDLAGLDDAYLLGDTLLVAPVMAQGGTSRTVLLPAGTWYDYWTGKTVPGGDSFQVDAPLDALPLYVRAGTVLPHWPLMQYTDERPVETLELRLYAGEGTSPLYEDAGEGKAYLEGDYRWSHFETRQTSGSLAVTWSRQGDFRPGYTRVDLQVYGLAERPAAVRIDGAPVEDWAWADGVLTLNSAEFDTLEIDGT